MRFKTHENLIDLLVGPNLYANPNVAMRELLQNAEDACQLQLLVDDKSNSEILVRYSPKENWVEINDNGLGMDRVVFEESFTTIGASKTTSPKLQQLLARAGEANRPIGQFGIGVLSCFGVADVVEVYSRADNEKPIAFKIADRHSDFEELDYVRPSRGTTVRLKLKPNGPMTAGQVPEAVRKYVRHARHIWLEDADANDRRVVDEHWLLESWDPSSPVSAQSIESGHMQLSDAWDNLGIGLDTQLVLCNAGFLVTETAKNVLAPHATGFRGEINVKPGALTILMNREGFQTDEAWTKFVEALTAHYRGLVKKKLTTWLIPHKKTHDQCRAIQRMVFLILKTPMAQIVGAENVELANQLLPEVLLLSDGNITDLRVTIRSTDLRVSLLRANGFAVTRAERHDYNLNFGDRNHTVQIHDFDVLNQYCNSLNVPIQRVENAPAEHTSIGISPDAEAVTKFMEISSNLKIQSVASMSDAIIADYNGYILNPENDEVRQILEIVPDAVGNPIRRQLLEAYFALSTYNITQARETILKLVADPNFEEKARQTTGRYFHEFLKSRIARLLAPKERADA